jgi:ribosomal protein S18 acetylase RimI-like enzyme
VIGIRQFEDGDWPAVWQVIAPVFRAGETWPVSPDVEEPAAREYWVDHPSATFVALDDGGRVLGSYYIKPNQPTLGAHVANCGYIVAEHARGRGVASRMCRHSQQEALARGYSAMQYNLVVSTNEAAVRLWRKQGFDVVGTLPLAFRHSRLGLVDAYVMYKLLQQDAQ